MNAMPEVVMVHGMWSTPRVWNRWRERFESRGWRTRALALPGHDGSHRPDLARLGLADCLAALERELDAVGAPAILLGHSLGGLLVQQAAARRRVVAAVLVCSGAPAPIFPQRPAIWPILGRHFLRWASWRKELLLSEREFDRLLFHAVPEHERPALHAGLQADSGRLAWEVAFGPFNFTGSNRVERAGPDCPLLALAGGRDRVVPPGVSRALARRYAGRIDYREHPEHGHWPLAGEPGWQQRADEVIDWLNRVIERQG